MTNNHDVDLSKLHELQHEVARLHRAVEELSMLNELARTISGTLDSRQIIQTIVSRATRAIQAEQGVITLIDREQPDRSHTLVRTRADSAHSDPLHLNEGLLGYMQIHQKPLRINNPRTDDRFRGVRWSDSIRSVLSAPLTVKSRLLGVISLYNRVGDATFSDEDKRLLSIIATQSAQVIENARLYEEEKSLLRMQEELRVARDIQLMLLPQVMPEVPGYDIAAVSLPAENVGGDYFDFIQKSETQFVFCLGDITGKGIPGAMLMANLQATIRGMTVSSDLCCECIVRANSLLFKSTESDRFATLFYGSLNPVTHELLYCNAGHNFPLLFRPVDEFEELQTGGIMIGVLENPPFEQGKTHFQRGDVLVVYSDGVTEAMNEGEEEFGEQRLQQAIVDNYQAPAQQIMENIISDVTRHAGSTPQWDDIALLIVKRIDSY